MKRTGFVEWFDQSSGEGSIFDPWSCESLYVHWSAITIAGQEGQRKNLSKHQPVEFSVYENLYMKQIDSVSPLVFNYTIENEHKLNDLMNQLWELEDTRAFDLADKYYEIAS